MGNQRLITQVIGPIAALGTLDVAVPSQVLDYKPWRGLMWLQDLGQAAATVGGPPLMEFRDVTPATLYSSQTTFNAIASAVPIVPGVVTVRVTNTSAVAVIQSMLLGWVLGGP